MPADVLIGPATVDDALGVATVHARAWQETYAHLIPGERLSQLSPADRLAGWARILAQPDEKVWVAQSHGEIVGWVASSVRDATQYPRALELNGIYTLASTHGSGIGQRLLQVAIGDAPAFLWSAADNPRAAAFYFKNGFALDGTTSDYVMLGAPVTIVRWVR